MKANELRLGNLVYRFEEDEGFFIEKVTHYQIEELQIIEEDSSLWNDGFYLTEIPLTKEWLLKFGFIANQYNDEFELYPLMFDCEYTDHREWNISYDGHPLSTEIQHVHQLQNLYFALTGEELTLKS